MATNNSINTPLISLGGTLTFSGAFTTTFTVTANTSVTLPTSGTLVNSAVTTLSSLVSIGTITTGTWNATKIAQAYGGTNIDSSVSTGVAQVAAGTWSVSTALPSTTTATTQTAGDNSTSVATDAFVTTAIANAVAGVDPAVAVLAATTTAANTSGFTYNNGVSGVGATLTQNSAAAVTIDGVAFNTIGQRLLVKNDTQTSPGSVSAGTFNGVYIVTTVGTGIIPAVFTRALDYDTTSDINNTGAIPVLSGTINALTSWLLNTTISAVGTGSNAITYTQFSFNPSNIVPPTLGGTGIANNIASTLTISGNFATTLTVTASTSVTLPTSGTLVSSVATGNGVSATNTGGALAFTLGAITPSTVNALTLTALTTGFTIAGGTTSKTLTVSNTLTLAGTDSTTMTFPSTSATIARTDSAQTFTGTQTFTQVIETANAITASANAATIPVTSKHNIVTNNSAATLTVTFTTTGAVNMQTVFVQILDSSAVAQTLTLVNTENSTVTPPATTNGSTTLPLSLQLSFNSATTKWRVIGYA